MAQVLRQSIIQRILSQDSRIAAAGALPTHKLYAGIELKRNKAKNNKVQLELPLSNIESTNVPQIINDLKSQYDCDECKITRKLTFPLDQNAFLRESLSTQTLADRLSPQTGFPEKLVLEYSSPNIAKPFHVGHMRSTIIGNFIANLYKSLGHNVVRINYLGDWGTQFGMLNVGINLCQISDTEMQSNPIHHLYTAYVHANQLSESDPTITERARQIFCDMEMNENSETLQNWHKYRQYTVTELTQIYQRLGVEFDEYSWESQYRKPAIGECIQKMFDAKIIEMESDGKAIVRFESGRCVPVLKSDGTTLYVTRDVAALMDRERRYQFDRMLYVVENGQHNHFEAIAGIAKRIGIKSADRIEHVKFGRVHGMSTRKGTAVFLSDILDEAESIMLQKQIDSPTTKVDVGKSTEIETANILGVSAVIVNDLKQRRTKDYEFDWSRVVQVTGDTGIKLQYTHCRLCSLEEVVGIESASNCDPNLLCEPEAIQLIYEIAKYPEIIYKCQSTLEAYILVKYLFSLCNTISRGLKVLNVKNHSNVDVQKQRILLFRTARLVLNQGMRIIGLKPLVKM